MINSIFLKDVSNELGCSKNLIRTKINNNEFKSLEKVNGLWCIDKNDFDSLKEEIEFKKNSYTLTEASNILNLSKYALLEKFKDIMKCYTGMGGRLYYVPKKIVDELELECKKNISELTGYDSIDEIYNRCNIDKNFIADGITCDYIKNYKLINSKYYIHESEISVLESDYLYKSTNYSGVELMEKFKLTLNQFKYNKEFICKCFQNKIIRKSTYFNKTEVDNFFENNNDLPNDFLLYINNMKINDTKQNNIKRINISKSHESAIITIDDNIYYTVNYIESTYKEFRGKLKNTFNKFESSILVNNKRYISKLEIDSILNPLRDSFPIEDIYNKLKEKFKIEGSSLSNDYIRKYLNTNEYFIFDKIGIKHIRVKAIDKDKKINEIVDKVSDDYIFRNTKNPYERYNLLIKNINDVYLKKYCFTIQTYGEMVLEKLNNSNQTNIINYVNYLFNSLNRLLNLIECEFINIKEDNIPNLLKDDLLSANDRLNITQYINYLKLKYPAECKFKKTYNSYIQSKERKDDDIYTENEWSNYLSYLTNIDIHIEKAFNDFIYARTWLYAILHFSLAWRKEDILNIQMLDFLDVSKYDLEWFKENTFTLTEAQTVINDIKRVLDGTVTLKTGAIKHFIIYNNLIVPTAIAFIITENHRYKNNFKTLFNIKSNMNKSDFSKIFDNNLDGFQNRKANRTLLSYIYSTATKMEGYTDISYSMATYARSHIVNNSGVSETTAQYISAINKDGQVLDVSKQLFRRGIFGWLYKTILDLSYENKYEDMEAMTIAIETLKDNLDINSMEGLSYYLQNEAKSRAEIINTLLNSSKIELKELINNLIQGNLVSKEQDTYCINTKNCPYPLETKCYCCKYSIPTNYTLLIIGEELKTLITKLESTSNDDTFNRRKYTYQIVKLLVVLKEAKTEFDKIDKNYIKSFLNLDKIQESLNKIKDEKFLMIKGDK